MKKIKYLLVAIMAVMLCIMCLMTSTFSWFLRPAKEGGSLIWSGNYQVSDGAEVEMETYEVVETSSGISAGTVAVTGFSNSNGLAQNSRKYYRTDIKNKNLTSAQSVSMYISGFKITSADNDNAYLGVNNPLKTYKNLSGSSVSYTIAYNSSGGDGESNNKLRFYFDHKNNWKDKTNISVYYNTNNNNIDTFSQATYREEMKKDDETGYYYAEISSEAKKMCIAVTGTTNNHYRTTTIDIGNIGLTVSTPKLISLNSSSGQWSVSTSSFTRPVILQYYNTITMTKGASFTLDLKEGTHFTGGKVSYAITSNSDIVDLNENKLTAKNVGQAEITITVTDNSNNTLTAKTIVEVVDKSLLSDIPVVTNCMVPKAVDADTPSIVSVYWYINNEGPDGLTYTIDDVYLSL